MLILRRLLSRCRHLQFVPKSTGSRITCCHLLQNCRLMALGALVDCTVPTYTDVKKSQKGKNGVNYVVEIYCPKIHSLIGSYVKPLRLRVQRSVFSSLQPTNIGSPSMVSTFTRHEWGWVWARIRNGTDLYREENMVGGPISSSYVQLDDENSFAVNVDQPIKSDTTLLFYL